MSNATASPRSLARATVRSVAPGPWPAARGLAVASAVASAVLLAAYGSRIGIGLAEVPLVVVGSLLLWGPLALGIDLLVRREVSDGATRFALAVVGSYAMTSALCFLWSMAGLPAGLYVTQVAVAIHAGACFWRRRRATDVRSPLRSRRPNWLLLFVVALSLFTTAPYTKVAEVTTAGSRNLRIPTDSLYYTSQAYELARSLPPTQDPTRAGTPPRSYHLLPHVTTVLLARATGQEDLLRVQVVYHLTVITLAMCAVLYALGKALAGRPLGGYALVALLYPLAIVGPPVLTETTLERRSFVQFFFTPVPQLSSLLEPAVFGSWQSYSAVLVALGLMLAVASISIRVHDGHPALSLLVLASLLVACLSRFRVQIFLVAGPAFVLVVAVAWLKKRQTSILAAGMAPLLAAVPLVLEATSSRYRPGTSGLALGFNGLTVRDVPIGRVNPSAIFSAWPYSRAVHDGLTGVLTGSAFSWTWQALCLTAFVLANMVGVLGLVALAVAASRREAWSTLRLLSLLVLVMVAGSILVGTLVKSDFDSYSLAGQALYLPGWYVFPAFAVVAGLAFSHLQGQVRLSSPAWVGAGMLLVAGGAWLRETGPTSRLTGFEYAQHIRAGDEMSLDRWRALQWLREETPRRSVVISNEYVDYRLVFSGIAGRAAYLEGLGDLNDTEAQRIYGDDRLAVVGDLWTTVDRGRFCGILRNTSSTHLVEFTGVPLAVDRPPCLDDAWTSPEEEVRIWRIK